MTDPRPVYQSRLESRHRQLRELDRRHRWLGPARLACFALAAATAWLAATRPGVSSGWVLLPVAAFAALVALDIR
ncbi:MAG: hypothetical protein KJZ47_11055, partial [Gemmatimonadales bacterium]|nr:hypothetical protein [Gemmatimonadales bacterium]